MQFLLQYIRQTLKITVSIPSTDLTVATDIKTESCVLRELVGSI